MPRYRGEVWYFQEDYVLIGKDWPHWLKSLKSKVTYCKTDIKNFEELIARLKREGWTDGWIEYYERQLERRRRVLKKYENQASLLLA